jgi:hypothetical protein
MKMIKFTPDQWREFETAYDKADEEGKESFMFNGNEYFTGYAKYVIQYKRGKP